MASRAGWTLAEVLVVLAIISLLAGLLVPSLSAARQQARLAACAASLRQVQTGLAGYATAHRRRFPPFAFSDFRGDLPQSGHWGGAGAAGSFCREGMETVNLWPVLAEERFDARALVCPAADEPPDGTAGDFPETDRFSTYCLRFPYSDALFSAAPHLADRGATLLGIYLQAGGGQRIRVGTAYERVPVVRLERRYPTAAPAACGDGDFDPASDALLSDAFWWREAADRTVDRARCAWCHGDRFNVARGDGSVHTASDDGTVRRNVNPPDGGLADDGANFATYAERVWQFFDAEP